MKIKCALLSSGSSEYGGRPLAGVSWISTTRWSQRAPAPAAGGCRRLRRGGGRDRGGTWEGPGKKERRSGGCGGAVHGGLAKTRGGLIRSVC